MSNLFFFDVFFYYTFQEKIDNVDFYLQDWQRGSPILGLSNLVSSPTYAELECTERQISMAKTKRRHNRTEKTRSNATSVRSNETNSYIQGNFKNTYILNANAHAMHSQITTIAIASTTNLLK